MKLALVFNQYECCGSHSANTKMQYDIVMYYFPNKPITDIRLTLMFFIKLFFSQHMINAMCTGSRRALRTYK